MAPLRPANAVNLSEWFSIRYPVPVSPVPGGTYDQPGVITGPCVTGGVQDQYMCQKSTMFKVSRCDFLGEGAEAQSDRIGTYGYVAKIDATKIRGERIDDDRDNNTFNLSVTNKVAYDLGGTRADIPDVDIAFYAEIGGVHPSFESCMTDPVVLDASTGAIPGAMRRSHDQPIALLASTIAHTSYKSYGDEIAAVFPSGRYRDPVDPSTVLVADTYWAVIAITYGTGVADDATTEVGATPLTDIEFLCRHTVYIGLPRQCEPGWFVTI